MEGAVGVLFRLVDRRFAEGLVSVAVLVVLCAAAGPAWGSFPGRNGEIVYGWSGERTYRGGPTASSIRAVDPRSGRVRVLRDCPLRKDVPVRYTDCEVSAPRYSPDGLRIAFPSARTALDSMGHPSQREWGLTTMASDGTGLEFYATGNVYSELAWAPAGDRFLLVRSLGSFGPNAIFLASLDGTELGQVTAGATREPDWSSRGQIAFTQSADPCPGPPGCDDIYITRLGGTPRRLTYRGGYSPSWSPDGKQLAFVRGVRNRAEIFLVGRGGRGLRRLTYRGGYNPAWSPDGEWIAFIRDGDLYVVRTNGRGRRRLVDSPFDGLQDWGSIDWQARPD
jgi:Tol biopolymer transport system component